ncbi:MAG TPA: pitrilysin family protein [Pyrinomonadaceae bacterium]|nr:pitrilysin family protein [Pyrinomonadaceae bacterium]
MEIKKLKQARRASVLSLACAFMLLFALGGEAWGQQQGAATPPQGVEAAPSKAAAPAPDKEKVKEVAATAASLVTEFEVNGLKVLVKRRAGSLSVSSGLFIRGGARNVTAENAGIEALMLDASTEASVGFPRETLRKELARMGTGISYSVGYDYSVLALGSTRANFERSFDIFADVALRPAFAPEDVKRVQNRLVISRRDDADTPDSFIQVLQSRVAYAGHPYMNDPDGTEQTLGRLTVEDLRRYHAQTMQTSRLLLVLVGDLDAAKVRESVTASFGKLPRGEYRSAPLPQLAFNAATVDVVQRAIPTNYIQGVFAAPPVSADDYYAMRVASSLLNDRVLYEVRYKRNLSYAPEAFLRNQGANIGGIAVSAVDANQAISVMLYEISKMQREPAPEDDINKVISGFLTQHYIGQETNSAQAGDLAMYELIGGGWRNSLTFLERIRAVTTKDVQRVAQKYMHHLRFVVLGDPARIDKNVFTVQLGE